MGTNGIQNMGGTDTGGDPAGQGDTLTLEQVAEMLGLDPERLMQLVQAGVLKASKGPDGEPVFEQADVMELAAKLKEVMSSRQQSAPPAPVAPSPGAGGAPPAYMRG